MKAHIQYMEESRTCIIQQVNQKPSIFFSVYVVGHDLGPF
jgi:hypothetical protein